MTGVDSVSIIEYLAVSRGISKDKAKIDHFDSTNFNTSIESAKQKKTEADKAAGLKAGKELLAAALKTSYGELSEAAASARRTTGGCPSNFRPLRPEGRLQHHW